MKSPSIQRSLLIRCGVGVGALFCLTSIVIYLLVRHSLLRDMDESITQTAALLANQMELENGKVIFEWQEGLGSNKSLNLEELFQYWDDRTGVTTRSPALGSHNLAKFQGKDGDPLVKTIFLQDGNRGRAVGLLVHPYVLPEEMERMRALGNVIDPKAQPHTLVVARNIEPMCRTLDYLRYVLVSGLFLTLALGFTLIDHVIRITLKPINDLTRQIHERTERQLDEALTLPGALPTELVGLAEKFDSLLSRVATNRQRERDFIRHAAHELRTPIAGLQATAELALSQTRDTPSYINYLQGCLKSAEEIGNLVKRLSALARTDQATSPVTLESIDLENLMDECLQTFLPFFKDRSLIVCRTRSTSPMNAMGDPTLVRIVFNNLLDNAAAYSPANGSIHIRFRNSGEFIELSISNPTDDLPEDLERLFEPLFRRNSSRDDASDHLGIGLTLSLNAACAMGGNLTAHKSDDGVEFVFSVAAVICEKS